MDQKTTEPNDEKPITVRAHIEKKGPKMDRKWPKITPQKKGIYGFSAFFFFETLTCKGSLSRMG